jgi:hypothetical protein
MTGPNGLYHYLTKTAPDAAALKLNFSHNSRRLPCPDAYLDTQTATHSPWCMPWWWTTDLVAIITTPPRKLLIRWMELVQHEHEQHLIVKTYDRNSARVGYSKFGPDNIPSDQLDPLALTRRVIS